MRGNDVMIEGAQIRFRNFSGKENKFNREGDRNFVVLLDEETARIMGDAGWNVKLLQPREDEEDGTPQPYLQVAVSFKIRPPKIVLITSGGRTYLDEESVSVLDHADFINVDIVVNPYNWEFGGNNGIKAYLKTMYATIEEDELEKKYRELEAS